MREVFADLGRVLGGWVLWRPRRTLAVIAAVLVLVGLVAATSGGAPARTTGQPHHPAQHPSTAVTQPQPTTPDATATVTVTAAPTAARHAAPKPPPRPPGLTIQQAAVAFVRAWVRTRPAARWVPGMTPYVTPRLLALFRLGDPLNVPASRVTGPAKVGGSADGMTAVQVPTDTYPALLTLVRVRGDWLIDDINMNRTPR